MATQYDISNLKQLGYSSNLPPVAQPSSAIKPSSYGQPITDSIFGINYLQTPLPVPMNKDHFGYTFFTRPQLNLQTANLLNKRSMNNLLSDTELSFERVVRCTLDPRLQFYGGSADITGENMGVNCALVDAFNPFIPMLSNHLITMSGIPDKQSPVYRSPEGQYREVHSMVDGVNAYNGAYNISATFRNSRGDPLTKLFDTWCDYPCNVFEGRLVSYLDLMLGGLLDYNTRIYRVTLDPSKRYIAGIFAPGAAFPLNVPKGQQYDYNSEKPYNDANQQMTINWECNGAIWDDDILIWSFNTVVGAFNSNMRTAKTRADTMRIVPMELASFFNCRSYPRIDAQTRRMEWWVPKEYFDVMARQAKQLIEYALDTTTGLGQKAVMDDLRASEFGAPGVIRT